MEKWSFAALQQTCTTAKEKGILPDSFGCGGKGVTKRSLYASLQEAGILTRTGDQKEQLSRKQPTYTVVHSSGGVPLNLYTSDSPFRQDDFESPGEAVGGTYNLLGAFMDIPSAYFALDQLIKGKLKQVKDSVEIKSQTLTLEKLEKQFAPDKDGAIKSSVVAAVITRKTATDTFIVHRLILDREQTDPNDLRSRYEKFGSNAKKLDLKSANYKSVKLSEVIEALKEKVRKLYKRVPVPKIGVFYNPDSDVWYVSASGIHSEETDKSSSNFIYRLAEGPSEDLDFKDLGVSPESVEKTKYPGLMSLAEVSADLQSGISPKILTIA